MDSHCMESSGSYDGPRDRNTLGRLRLGILFRTCARSRGYTTRIKCLCEVRCRSSFFMAPGTILRFWTILYMSGLRSHQLVFR